MSETLPVLVLLATNVPELVKQNKPGKIGAMGKHW